MMIPASNTSQRIARRPFLGGDGLRYVSCKDPSGSLLFTAGRNVAELVGEECAESCGVKELKGARGGSRKLSCSPDGVLKPDIPKEERAAAKDEGKRPRRMKA